MLFDQMSWSIMPCKTAGLGLLRGSGLKIAEKNLAF